MQWPGALALPFNYVRTGGLTRVGDRLMVRADKLSAVLSEFARTLATDFPIQAILDHLVQRIVEVLPVSAAGVTLITAGEAPRYVAASDDSALRFERLQTEFGQGPCLAAYDSGQAVSAPDLRVDGRWPAFSPAAVAAGLLAVFTFPLHQGALRLGALDLYRDTPGDLDPIDMEAAATLADVAAAYLINADAREVARATSDGFHFSATHDALTGLPNRQLLQQRLEDSVLRARRSHAGAAILFLDLDQFKIVNDSHGHSVGDELLVRVSERLSTLVRPGDTLARLSGDEFVFLCVELESLADARALAERVGQAFAAPFVLNHAEIASSASIGVAYTENLGEEWDHLLEDADVAMYQAKRQGGAGHRLLDPVEATRSRAKVSLEADLRHAFTTGALDVAYQPIVRTADGRTIGVEALLRWSHPERGSIPALSTVAIAEQSGLICGIGEEVIARACRDREGWMNDSPRVAVDVSVNVSPRQLIRTDFTQTIAAILSEAGMAPGDLVIEVTDHASIDYGDQVLRTFTELKSLGVRLALDNFGAGSASLSDLRRLPIDVVKLDRCLIQEVTDRGEGQRIVQAIAMIANALNLTVSAEGVETREQHDEVIALGCENAQGFYYARPMKTLAMTDHLAEDSRILPRQMAH